MHANLRGMRAGAPACILWRPCSLTTRQARSAGPMRVRSAISEEDRQHMRRAIELARRGEGSTFPNPAVGCVIIKDRQVIGEGFHPRAGMPHAEVYALRAAGQAAQGATAYVSLEPCNHFGRTPPCSRALVAAGVKRVVVGVGDPNLLVGGSGIQTLESACIEVELVGGEEEQAAYDLNAEFMERMKAQQAQQ